MSTYRQILEPVVGAVALREAEARVYARKLATLGGTRYACAEGFCAAGIILRELGITAGGKPIRFPTVGEFPFVTFVGAGRVRVTRSHPALNRIIRANDSGGLATPGSLTVLLDSEVAA